MIQNIALGQYLAHLSARDLTMAAAVDVKMVMAYVGEYIQENLNSVPAFVWKRSSLDIPGFLGTPAGITTTSAPVNLKVIV